MNARPVEWDGEVTALVVTPTDGRLPFLVPPIVFDKAGDVVTGRDVLAGVDVGDVTVSPPPPRPRRRGSASLLTWRDTAEH